MVSLPFLRLFILSIHLASNSYIVSMLASLLSFGLVFSICICIKKSGLRI